MKRDLELIRKILLNVEADKYAYGASVRVEGYPDEIVGQHVALLLDAGLVEGRLRMTDAYGIVGAMIDRLTNSGHDFCAAIHEDTIWNKVRAKVIKPGIAFSLKLVMEMVQELVKQQFPGAH